MKINSDLLKESITIESMIGLLQELGATYIEDKRDKGFIVFDTICHNPSGHGSSKLFYYPEGHTFHCYTECSHSFDVFELVSKVYKQRNVDVHFSNILEYVATQTGHQPKMGFGEAFQINLEKKTTGDLEWLNRVTQRRKRKMPELKTYNEELLEVFSTWHHPMFLNDGISAETMDKYKVKYYEVENRLVIPYYDHRTNRLLGLRGRTLDKREVDAGRKYMPISVQGNMYNFPTYSTLFGLHKNAETIKRLKKVCIFEAEKSVMQCDTMYGDNNFTVALSSKNTSDFTLDYLLELGVEEAIFAFDKMYKQYGDEDYHKYVEFVLSKVRRFVPYMRVYVVQDTTGLLEEDDSPSDRGQEVLEQLMKEKVEVLLRSD